MKHKPKIHGSDAFAEVRGGPRAFTLIELLVVVTIIVVLLSLLVPAMDQAIYQTELAVCATKLRTIATGAITYAHGQKRMYPDRPSRTSNGSCRPSDIYWGQNENKDDRTILKTFLDLNKALNDPLIRAIDIEGSEGSVIVVPYALYFGWGYDRPKPGLGDKAMRRLGDRWTYTTLSNGPSIIESFSVLASDWDGQIGTEQLQNQSSHPDRDGVLENFTIQDEIYTGVLVPRPVTLTVWRGPMRGPIDTNYAYDDGSVSRFNNVLWNEGQPESPSDQGLVKVHQADAQNSEAMLRVPRR